MTEGTRRAIDAGALYTEGLAQGTRLRLNWVTGAWTGLAEAAEALRHKHSELGPIVMEASLILGALATTRGEFATAQRHLAATSVLAPEHGPIPVVLAAAGALIRVRLATADVAGRAARHGRPLSPRERELARMLANGRTNREIADDLFLSPRTVEQHVAKVLRKLGVRSPTEIAQTISVNDEADDRLAVP
jgi:DNA-binding NarL/FixJ family response regulator